LGGEEEAEKEEEKGARKAIIWRSSHEDMSERELTPKFRGKKRVKKPRLDKAYNKKNVRLGVRDEKNKDPDKKRERLVET